MTMNKCASRQLFKSRGWMAQGIDAGAAASGRAS